MAETQAEQPRNPPPVALLTRGEEHLRNAPLVRAILRQDHREVSQLLEEAPGRINAESWLGLPPLAAAVLTGNRMLVRQLIWRGADVQAPVKPGDQQVTLPDLRYWYPYLSSCEAGATALSLAACGGHTEVLDDLVRADACGVLGPRIGDPHARIGVVSLGGEHEQTLLSLLGAHTGSVEDGEAGEPGPSSVGELKLPVQQLEGNSSSASAAGHAAQFGRGGDGLEELLCRFMSSSARLLDAPPRPAASASPNQLQAFERRVLQSTEPGGRHLRLSRYARREAEEEGAAAQGTAALRDEEQRAAPRQRRASCVVSVDELARLASTRLQREPGPRGAPLLDELASCARAAGGGPTQAASACSHAEPGRCLLLSTALLQRLLAAAVSSGDVRAAELMLRLKATPAARVQGRPLLLLAAALPEPAAMLHLLHARGGCGYRMDHLRLAASTLDAQVLSALLTQLGPPSHQQYGPDHHHHTRTLLLQRRFHVPLPPPPPLRCLIGDSTYRDLHASPYYLVLHAHLRLSQAGEMAPQEAEWRASKCAEVLAQHGLGPFPAQQAVLTAPSPADWLQLDSLNRRVWAACAGAEAIPWDCTSHARYPQPFKATVRAMLLAAHRQRLVCPALEAVLGIPDLRDALVRLLAPF